MTFELAADRYVLPVFSNASSYTRLARDTNDPYRALKNSPDIKEMALHPARTFIKKLKTLNNDWDGFGSVRPNSAAIQYALSFIDDLYLNALSTQLPWIQPHITSSEDGDVVFEWWSGTHKLTVYVGDGSSEYFQVWGPDIQTQMKDGNLEGEKFQGLWRWLLA